MPDRITVTLISSSVICAISPRWPRSYISGGGLAVLASPGSKLAGREAVALGELSGERFLVNPRSLAPAAFEGLKLMCREFGGFDATVLESAVASTAALDTDWRPVRDGVVIAIMAEATARAVCPADVSVVPVRPPPQYVPRVGLAWRRASGGSQPIPGPPSVLP